jgi:hypothetical protein
MYHKRTTITLLSKLKKQKQKLLNIWLTCTVFFCYSGHFLNIFFLHIFILILLNIHMPVDYKYILFNIKNDKFFIKKEIYVFNLGI